MNLKHQNINIDTEHPFANCILRREQYATILTSLVRSYAVIQEISNSNFVRAVTIFD